MVSLSLLIRKLCFSVYAQQRSYWWSRNQNTGTAKNSSAQGQLLLHYVKGNTDQFLPQGKVIIIQRYVGYIYVHVYVL